MSLLDTASLVVTPNGTKAGKLYSVVPSSGAGDLDVTRATTATRVNSSGLIESVASNVPRLDYSNGTCPSILVEPQRTNLLTYSEDFSNISYVKLDSTVSTNTNISPDGTNNADSLIENTNNSIHGFIRDITQTTSGSYTISFFVKANGRTKFEISEGFSIGGNVQFDLVAKTAITSSPAVNGFIKEYANGWFRVGATWNLTALAYTLIYVVIKDNAGNFTYTGDGTSGLFIWGAQLEAGSYATSYIPTTSASVTRNADVISKTGISSLIGQTEGTLFIDVYRPNLSSGFIFMLANSVGANAYLNSIYLFQTPTSQLACDIFIAGVQQVGITTSSSGLSIGRNKIAIAYKQNDFVLYINGTQIGSDTSGNIPTLSAFEINGADISSVSNVQTNLTALWKTRLTNTQLAQLTTI